MPPIHFTLTKAPFRPRSIGSLAPETLLQIFDYLFQDAKLAMEDDQYDIVSLFPFTTASVCRDWLGALALKATYWTNVVIPLDFPILPSIMTAYVDMIRHQTIVNVHVIYCELSTVHIKAGTERARVGSAMRLLKPHLPKCETIVIDTRYRSSVIVATDHLDCLTVDPLNKLALVSAVSDTVDESEFTHFTCPNLISLSIDAKTLVDFIASDGPKGNPRDHAAIKELNVTTYRAEVECGLPELLSTEVVRAICDLVKEYGWLDTLTIEDIVCEDDGDVDGYSEGDEALLMLLMPIIRNVGDVYLTDLNGPFLHSFFIGFNPPNDGGESRVVSLTRCSLHVPVTIRNTCKLKLYEMNDIKHVMHALAHWDGLHLSVEDCQGFGDPVLDTITLSGFCPTFGGLYIDNCPVSLPSMRRFVSMREGELWRLKVSGGPELSEEDKQKFKDSISDGLTWNGEVIL
ncbi:hypothetical protein CONPUDRAFT_162877 [Coniophora puteana RWD-64-598 SS2]|uniref:F-box domain-containing protein n=1 Tax=Coniophora puteana (strain RWD-64-598) TaxID=741705 RepID=A0A5M3N4K2_CONPW|nr:uncharacterized protein CONPUDRAFT_162877 [Coniophora puteana RWD-64-598 SS2]EIW85765.1 hypothetical protein CONPUDRAFT_162877 [Coniophora puteana RWD-64-598 SS2]